MLNSKRYDKSDMKQNMIDQYGKEEDVKIYFASTKQAMKDYQKSKINHERVQKLEKDPRKDKGQKGNE